MEKKSKYFFDHIPKTGGTSLNTLFQHILGKNNVSPLLLFEKLTLSLKEYTACQFLQGHFIIAPRDNLDASRFAITLLRNPIDRCLSHYFFTQSLPAGSR